MASPSKKQRLTRAETVVVQPKKVFTQICVYILPIKLPNQRVQFLKQLAAKKGFPITESFTSDVTHIVTAVKSMERIQAHLEGANIDNREVVTVEWLTTSFTEGQPARVTDRFRIVPHKQISMDRLSSLESCTDLTDAGSENESSHQLSKYECQRATVLDHPNKTLTEALELLETHALLIGGEQSRNRALAFRRSSTALKGLPKDIESVDEISSLAYIGNHAFRVIKEIVEKGQSEEVEKIRSSEFFQVTKVFNTLFGVGPSTARYWYDRGYRTLDDLRNANDLKLTDRQQAALDYYDDLCAPVSYEQAQCVCNFIQQEVTKILPGAKVMIVGGHRRGKKVGHDIDLLIWHPEEGKEHGLLPALVAKLDEKNYTVYKEMINIGANNDDMLRIHYRAPDAKEKNAIVMDHLERCFGIFKLPCSLLKLPENDGEQSAVARRIDLIVTPASQWAYALVGWTGNKQYNRSLRLYAWRELQMTLSSHVAFDCRQQKLLPASSEEEIFEILKLPYREPWERNC